MASPYPSSLRYPKESIGTNQSYFKIEVIKKIPRGLPRSFANTFGANDLAAGNPEVSTTVTRPLSTIYLPMPLGITDSNQVSWGDARLNNLETFAVQSFLDAVEKSTQGTGLLDTAGSIGASLAGSAEAGAEQLNNPNVNLALRNAVAAEALKIFGSQVSANQLLGRTTGQILNPYLELLFDGVNLRNFIFDFKFTPRDADESLEVKKIINVLKRAQAPKTSTTDTQGWFIQSPEVFRISFRKGGNKHPFLFSMKTCGLKRIDVNYSDSSQENYASYYDGTPTSLVMSLDFTELSPVFHEDYNDGFNNELLNDGVGF